MKTLDSAGLGVFLVSALSAHADRLADSVPGCPVFSSVLDGFVDSLFSFKSRQVRSCQGRNGFVLVVAGEVLRLGIVGKPVGCLVESHACVGFTHDLSPQEFGSGFHGVDDYFRVNDSDFDQLGVPFGANDHCEAFIVSVNKDRVGYGVKNIEIFNAVFSGAFPNLHFVNIPEQNPACQFLFTKKGFRQ